MLETARVGGVPTLVASYWGNVNVLDGFSKFGFTTIGQQTDRVFMFRGSRGLYASTAPHTRDIPQPLLSRVALPIGGAIISLILFILMISRRKRRPGSAA